MSVKKVNDKENLCGDPWFLKGKMILQTMSLPAQRGNRELCITNMQAQMYYAFLHSPITMSLRETKQSRTVLHQHAGSNVLRIPAQPNNYVIARNEAIANCASPTCRLKCITHSRHRHGTL